MKFFISDIKFDIDGENDLPTEMEIDVPVNLNSEEKLDFIADEISNRTGFCHFGFTTFPEIN